MDPGIFVRGLLIGLSIAAPVGPIGVICIRRTLAEGRWAGLVSGLGAATADAIYGSIAAFGLTLVATALTTQQFWFRLLGGAFLCYLGVRAFLAVPGASRIDGPGPMTSDLPPDTGQPVGPSANTAKRFLGVYASTFGLTLTNPMTILSFVAIYTGLGMGGDYSSIISAVLMVLGVFAGSVLWWFVLSTGAGLLRARLTPESLRWVNRVSGAVVIAFGLITLVGAVRG